MLKTFFKNLISRDRWVIVSSTQKVEEYARVKGKLNDRGIKVRTKILNLAGPGERSVVGNNILYQVLVRDSELYRAQEVIHRH